MSASVLRIAAPEELDACILPAEQLSLLRAIGKAAIVLIALFLLDRPAGPRYLAALLDLNEHTVAGYLDRLARLNLVARAGYRQGYVLVNGRQLLLGENPNVKNPHFGSSSIISINDPINESDSEIIIVEEESVPNAKKPQFRSANAKKPQFSRRPSSRNAQNPQLPAGDSPPSTAPPAPPDPSLLAALQEAGIREPKRSALAALPHLTAGAVKAWEATLRRETGNRYTPGLLIYVLQSGNPAPPLNQNGHLLDCECDHCRRTRYPTCRHCGAISCACPDP